MVIMIGNKACDPYIINLVYGEYVEPKRIGTIPWLGLNREIQRSGEKAGLVFFRHSRFRPRGTVAQRMLVMPYYIAQSADLPPADVDLLSIFYNASTKTDLKRIQSAKFEYEITQDPEQLEFFYHQMYAPMILSRHKNAAQVVRWEYFKEVYGKMELLLILKAGRPVGGSIISQTGDCLNKHIFGLLNADHELRKEGIGASNYWFSIVEAHRRGCATINYQCSRPFLKNGIIAYKKKWGGRIIMDRRERELWLLPDLNRPSVSRFLEENPFICEQDGLLVSLIFLGSWISLNDEELSIYFKNIHIQGDHLSTFVILLNDEWVARKEMIQNILRTLPQPSRILDLSNTSLTELQNLIRENGYPLHARQADLP